MPLTNATYLASDVATDVKRTFGDEAGIQITDTDIIRWLNRALLELHTNLQINRAVGQTDLVSAQDLYDITSLNILKIQSIHILGRQAKYLSFQEFEDYINNDSPPSTQTTVGVPQIWTEWAGKIRLYPAPDKAYTSGMAIYYLPYPTKIASLSDSVQVPDKYYNRVIEYVQAQAHELDEDQQSAQYKLGQFADGVDSIRNDENSPYINYYPTITVLDEDQ